MPPPDAGTGPHIAASQETHNFSQTATSSPRRRGPTQAPANSLSAASQLAAAGASAVAYPAARVGDVRDAAGTIWRDGAFRRDAWVLAVDGEPLPETSAILTKKRWLAERDTLAGRDSPLGLHLDAGEPIDDIASDLGRFALINLGFPKFSDGRAFSTARLLRDKHGYRGELRAVGNVLSDLIPLMRRVGFDAFEVAHLPTRRALTEGRIPEVTLHYQPAEAPEPPAGTRPWQRRAGA
jgi:uncharacterized protein (DUF934 family)